MVRNRRDAFYWVATHIKQYFLWDTAVVCLPLIFFFFFRPGFSVSPQGLALPSYNYFCSCVLARFYSCQLVMLSKTQFLRITRWELNTRHLPLIYMQLLYSIYRSVNETSERRFLANEISWEYAAHCIGNALVLTGRERDCVYLLPWLYAASAFINLNLGRYGMAYTAACQLAKLPQVSPHHKLMATLFKVSPSNCFFVECTQAKALLESQKT